MNFTVVNKELNVEQIRIIGVASASVVLIGDAETVGTSSVFDTPPEAAVTTQPLVPLSPEGSH
ncbi:putative spore germination protein GerPD [Pullulanibacillus camelliae]|uniref:Putative spore germination protein GerPD n=1 Tax=Pullulanibacillus camelliae TaxID=1707096 RepID=A0A8J2VSM0_9BACL|nr:spore gernimation protein GerPD [Pullulanibacillus camelliae]GGE39186.1 putative spore germination protein GerPD [Pullulanibacillus camelliae]